MSLPLFLIPLLAGIAAQSLKPLLNRRLYSPLKIAGKQIPRYGGMPSAHSAFAFSLATVVGMVDGFFSTTFAIAAAALILILDDALRMRIFLGRYGEALNRLIDQLPQEARTTYPYIESRLGHRPAEVFAGGALGIAITLLILYLLSL